MSVKFDKYLKNYTSTEIPLIQRDYVQGAEFWKSKRDPFVTLLLDALQSGKNETLNFIYGTSIDDGQNMGKKRFVPLDGQQRLTTLNLLGWLLLQAVKLKSPADDNPSWLNGLSLSYQTRASSREFCAKLLKSDLKNAEEIPSAQIKNSLWFAESWSYDPTIRAMLDMLDYIWRQLAQYEENWADMAKRFFTGSPIDFELLELEEHNPDDLYIKINARGKPLTEFEHWKAWFIGKLNNRLKTYFEIKIETDWCDFFWQFAQEDAHRMDYPRIDEYFMRFFAFITDILGGIDDPQNRPYTEYIEKRDNTGAREVIEKIYFNGNTDNLKLLFRLLNTLPQIDDLSTYLFSTTNPCDPMIADENTKVNIFGENDELNLLHSLLKGDELNYRVKFLLWGIIKYVRLHNKTQLQDFIRVWWGIIMNIRQRLAKGFVVTSDLGYNEYGKLNDMLDIILKSPDPFANTGSLSSNRTITSWLRYNSYNFHNSRPTRYNEDIIRLQNHPWLLYDVHVLDSLISGTAIQDGDVFDRFFNQFVALKDNTQAKALLEHGFAGCVPKKDYVTYGLTGNWAYILTDDASPAADPLCALLRGNAQSGPATWPSDFVCKYYDILKCMAGDFNAFYKDTQKGILFGAKNSLRKQGYIMEPYNYVTAIQAGLTQSYGISLVKYGSGLSDNRLQLFTENAEHWGICFLAYGIEMEPVKGGWILNCYDNTLQPLTAAFIARFGGPNAWKDTQHIFTISANGFVGKLAGKDRVETGVELLKAIIQLL